MEKSGFTSNELAGVVFSETLSRAGSCGIVISPGSRSSPLTLACATHRDLWARPVLDERSAGFIALGRAMALRRPAVLLCTSGTAGTHYFPAVVEARLSGIPLVVVTADRPPELRDCGSGQTIDQTKLFGDFVVGYREISLPERSMEYASYLREQLLEALYQASAQRGPFHLNFPFRDPLVPDHRNFESFASSRQGILSFLGASHWASMQDVCGGLPAPLPSHHHWWEKLPAAARGLIVAGADFWNDYDAYAEKLAALGKAMGWPIISDPLNPVRSMRTRAKGVVSHYAMAWEKNHGKELESLRPDILLQVGQLPIHKGFRAWIKTLPGRRFRLDSTGFNLDPHHSGAVRLRGRVEGLPIHPEGRNKKDLEWMEGWERLEEICHREIGAACQAGEDGLREPLIPWHLTETLICPVDLLLGNSLPVRHAEKSLGELAPGSRVFCNRGANGIDGTVSTAVGLASAGANSVVAVVGDLAFLHDVGALASLRDMDVPVLILILDNRGGRIFEGLPISRFEPPFERFFATPQPVSFKELTKAYGVAFSEAGSVSALRDQIRHWEGVGGLRVLRLVI